MRRVQRFGIGLFILAWVMFQGIPAFAESASSEGSSKSSASAEGKAGAVQCPPGMAPAGTAAGSPITKQPDGTNPCTEPSTKGAGTIAGGASSDSSNNEQEGKLKAGSPSAGGENIGKGGTGHTRGEGS